MTVHIFFDSQITVRRLKTVSGNKTTFQATATVDTHVRSMSEREAEAVELHPARAFKMYVDLLEDIKEGDKIQWVENVQEGVNQTTRTRQFTVKQVDQPKVWMSEHKELICEEVKES